MDGPGGITCLLAIAFPMIISQAADTCMMFCDRYFLAQLGSEYLAGGMLGGASSFLVMSLWFGVIGYVNALVAQHHGAKKYEKRSVAVTQGFILTLIAFPLILLCIAPMKALFTLSQPDPRQLEPQNIYFTILVYGAPLTLLRVAIASFFSGIGKTRTVMIASLLGMFVNIPCSYALVFGKWGMPALGTTGAAYGTLIGSATILAILALHYIIYHRMEKISLLRSLRFDKPLFVKLIRYGFPSGLELFLVIAAWNLVMLQFHSYSLDVAAAMSITFSWELIAFLPMFGLNVATTSLVGQNMGAKDVYEAERSGYSGLKVALCYSLAMTVTFLSFSHYLVSIFLNDATENTETVLYLGKIFLQLAALYLSSDACALVFSGALRGAGDTFSVMCTTVGFYWVFLVIELYLITVAHVSPITSWAVFITLPIGLFFAIYRRFKKGHWKKLSLVS
jgi:multidrug resistance protein, MATE family